MSKALSNNNLGINNLIFPFHKISIIKIGKPKV